MSSPHAHRNASIDLFRYICSVMVVIIHTSPLSEYNPQISYFLTNIFPRIAVPFFFSVSGYFYIKKLEAGTARFLPYISRLVTVYGIWSCLYFGISFLEWGHSSLRTFLISCPTQFFITGSSEHFWFFPALILSVSLVTLIYKLRLQKLLLPMSLLCYALGCFSCAYYTVFSELALFRPLFAWTHFNTLRRILLMGFPFFSSGLATIRLEKCWQNRRRTVIPVYIAALVLWAGEILIAGRMQLYRSFILTFGLYFLVLAVMQVLLEYPLPGFQKVSDKARAIANFTYYAHPFFLTCLTYSSYLITGSDMPSTPRFLLCIVMTFVCGNLLSKWNNRIAKLVLV